MADDQEIDRPSCSGSRLFQLHEDDLAELERMLPQVFEALTMRPDATPLQRTWFRRAQTIMTNIRWRYGPPTEVGIIPSDDD